MIIAHLVPVACSNLLEKLLQHPLDGTLSYHRATSVLHLLVQPTHSTLLTAGGGSVVDFVMLPWHEFKIELGSLRLTQEGNEKIIWDDSNASLLNIYHWLSHYSLLTHQLLYLHCIKEKMAMEKF